MQQLEGERVLWSGQPGQGLLFSARDGLLVPFSLLWCGFAIFWEASVLRTGATGFFVLWGVPFVLVGLYLAAGRFVVDAWLRRQTTYAVTDRRILIRRSGPFAKVTAIGLDRLPVTSLVEGADGRGSIRFGEQISVVGGGWNGMSSWTPSLDLTPQFIAIANARQVFDLVQRLAQQTSRP